MYRDEIIRKTTAEIRTFLDELANGTSNYRSLHNLTEQVEHQYHGRFLIELIQNAHDALFERNERADERRIEIAMSTEEIPFGTLYVANDGRPFTRSNFESLCKLGQSDKDPEKSIGDKGIGFRSILQICTAPEIYSRSDPGSHEFDGYCFRFSPGVTRQFEGEILELLDGNLSVASPIDQRMSLVMWDERKLGEFLLRNSRVGKDWLRRELALLSPYLLPLPLNSDRKTAHVLDFERRGFATVVRLPFVTAEACALAREELAAFGVTTVLFLDRVRSLRLVWPGGERTYRREQEQITGDREGGYEIHLAEESRDDDESFSRPPKRYWLWEQSIGGPEDPAGRDKIAKAVAHLPGKWPEVIKATVALAVLVGEEPEEGALSIYLPTDLPSGCEAHLSGPFFGDMSRKHVEFGNSGYNELLLTTLAEKAVAIVFNSLTGKGTLEAAAIIDLLAPMNGAEGTRWWAAVNQAFAAKSTEITRADIILTNSGWTSLPAARLLPKLKEPEVLTQAVLREEASYPVLPLELESRESCFQRLFDRTGIPSVAPSEWQADAIEKIAVRLHQDGEEANWNGFWRDVTKLLERSWEPLKGKRVLLGTDNQLHASDDKSSVFFRPLRSPGDPVVGSDDHLDEVPSGLRPFVAFLHQRIKTHVQGDRGRLQPTAIHAYLSSGLVSTFGVEQILKNVLIPATPVLPVTRESDEGALCQDILQWGLQLVSNLVTKDRGDSTLKLLGQLPAPCVGGWYPLGRTCFGPGWEDTAGRDVEAYLREVNTSESVEASKLLLLPPDHPHRAGIGTVARQVLVHVGVLDGLRPILIKSGQWQSSFLVSSSRGFCLPETPPPCFSEELWKAYRETIAQTLEPRYKHLFLYQMQDFFAIPGLERFEAFAPKTREALCRALLASMGNWACLGAWNRADLRKMDGEWHSQSVQSPLEFALRELAWLCVHTEDGPLMFRPRDRWYIPSSGLIGGRHQYGHLNPLPPAIGSYIDRRPELLSVLKSLGMPHYDEENPTAHPRLLDDLARALEDPNVEIANKDVFLGQVRTAWSLFEPQEGGRFPTRVVVQRRRGELSTVLPSPEQPIYLPDASAAVHDGLELHERLVVVINPKDARRLQGYFQGAFGDGVRLASDLEVKPVVNGKPWSVVDARPLADWGLDWLAPVLLAVFAYGGDQSRGTGTKTFAGAMDRLKEARIAWVEALEAGLWRGDQLELKIPVSALWLSRERVLVARSDSRNKYSELSDRLAAVMDRADLEFQLKYVLGRLDDCTDPTQEQIAAALDGLRISADRYNEVQQKWLGDLAWLIRMLRPLVLVLNPIADLAPLVEVTSEEQALAYLGSTPIPPLEPQGALSVARTARSLDVLGRILHEASATRAELQSWNQALAQLGEPEARNYRASEEFREHLESARTVLRSVIRHLLRCKPELDGFQNLDAALSSLECPWDYPSRFWEVGFPETMSVVSRHFEGLGAEDEILSAISEATSVRELKERLVTLGLDPETDPIAIHAENHRGFLQTIATVQKVAVAWCLKNGIEPDMWDSDPSTFLSQLAKEFSREAFLDSWNEKQRLEILKRAERSEQHTEFWSALDRTASLAELQLSLGVSDVDLGEALGKLKVHKQRMEEKRRTVTVCGQDFVNTEDNLKNLWDHIVLRVSDGNLPEIRLDDPAQLPDIPPKRQRRDSARERVTKPGGHKGRPSKAMTDLVGLAGEIHAYRTLQKMYGAEEIGPSCWISENSRYRYPENATNDSYGCDFVVRYGGRTHFVEVKATQGEDTSFELSASEIELAIEKAGKRKQIFLVLHVVDALSEHPRSSILPNPYDSRHKSKYQFEEAGLRVRYEKPQS